MATIRSFEMARRPCAEAKALKRPRFLSFVVVTLVAVATVGSRFGSFVSALQVPTVPPARIGSLSASSINVSTHRVARLSHPFPSNRNDIASGGVPSRFSVLMLAASSSSSTTTTSSLVAAAPTHLRKDVLIIGGGLAGLSTALYLSQMDPTRHITILDVEPVVNDKNGDRNMAAASSLAAAGMLAPHSERLPKGDYLDLCMASKHEFRDFCHLVETLAKEAATNDMNDARRRFFPESSVADERRQDTHSKNSGSLDPWNVGYVAAGGFLAPAFAGDNVATWAPPEADGNGSSSSSSAVWLDDMQVRELEPHLHPDVVGGWWFPEDASVDARRLTRSLKAACVGAAGVEYLCNGSQYEVSSLDLQEGEARGVWLKHTGKYIAAKDILVANGAWMRTLLPVPLEPHKGQSLSLRMPQDRPPLLRRVLFAQDSYIVPKADGRIVIGATVEAGSFDANVTPAGIMHILTHALQLVPGLADLPMEETWAGLRPTTPDKGPILGTTKWKNLYLAGGYWRNGVLLAPKTGQMMAALISGKTESLSERDQELLQAFNWDRFTSPEGAKRLAANTRYAASMYPIHTRRSGAGVAAAVGTELGSYSTARSAGEERKRDRETLFGTTGNAGGEGDDSDELFERAAMLGQKDASAFEGFEGLARQAEPRNVDLEDIMPQPTQRAMPSLEASTSMATATIPYDGSADAITVGAALNRPASDTATPAAQDLDSIYQTIRDNKASKKVELPENKGEEKPDPGFRIYHVDKETGEQTEVPPFTTTGEFLENLRASKAKMAAADQPSVFPSTPNEDSSSVVNGDPTSASQNGKAKYDETTYDGYQAIFDANASTSREEELNAMREARRKNRSGQTDLPGYK